MFLDTVHLIWIRYDMVRFVCISKNLFSVSYMYFVHISLRSSTVAVSFCHFPSFFSIINSNTNFHNHPFFEKSGEVCSFFLVRVLVTEGKYSQLPVFDWAGSLTISVCLLQYVSFWYNWAKYLQIDLFYTYSSNVSNNFSFSI